MQQPQPSLNTSIDDATPAVSVSWQDIDQASDYALVLTQVGQPSPPATIINDPSVDLSAQLGSNSAWSLQLASHYGIITSAFTDGASLSTPTANLLYDTSGPTPSLTLSWQAVADAAQYLITWSVSGGGTAPPAQFVAPPTTSLPPITDGLTEDAIFTANVQAIAVGGLSATSSVQETINDIPAPTDLAAVSQPTADDPGSVTLSWQFDHADIPDSQFKIQILDSTGTEVASGNTADTQITLSSNSFIPAAWFYRASLAGNPDLPRPGRRATGVYLTCTAEFQRWLQCAKQPDQRQLGSRQRVGGSQTRASQFATGSALSVRSATTTALHRRPIPR